VPVIVTVLSAVTGSVETVKPAVAAPAGTVTVAGTEATAGIEDTSDTVAPLGGAGPLSVSVPLTATPPETLAAESVSVLSVGARTATLARTVAPAYTAEMEDDVFAATGLVEMGNVAVVAPAGAVKVAGTVAAAVLLLVRFTVIPGDGAFRKIVPVAPAPPVTVVGAIDNAPRRGWGTSVLLSTIGPEVAVIRSA
jgi:hypothetical protein